MTAAGATDFDIATLWARRTNKWHKFPPDVLPAWVADMDFGVASSITDALTRLTQNQEYGYAAREGVLAEAFVRRMERRFGWHTDPADTLAVGDLVQASFSSVMAFSEPGDAVLLQLPSYPPFMRAIEDTGRRLIANPMRDDGTRWVLDLAAYEAAPDPRTRMLIFCHPQNPTGRAFSRAELEAVATFAIRHDLVVVSDEIHADIVYPGNTHIPLASLHPEIAARTITITSATKSFNIPALRCAVMHFGSPELKGRFGRRIPSRLLGSPGVTGVDATVAAWDDGQNWLDEILAQLRANRDLLAHTIESDLPGVTMRVPEATYLAWLDCRALDLPCSAGEFFLDHARVGLNFGETFGAEYTGFARLNFATRAPILRQIVTRMVESVRRRWEMANRSAEESRLIDRRTVLQVAAALAAAGPALMREGHAAARPPVVIDAQVHAYAANTPERPWHSVPNWPAHVTGDEMVAAMDKVGVDGAIYISPFSMYQYDGSYAVSVQRAHPDKFALVKPVNPDDPAVADVIADWKKTPGTVGIRIILTKESKRAPDDPGLDRILSAAVKNDFPVNVLFWGNVDAGTALIDRHPDARFIIDHMGIQQPSVPPAPPQPWADLPKVVELAKRKNAVIKITGACTLSKEPYPFPDIWDPLARIFDAWGFERCLWGTDWTRAFAVVNYEQGVEPFLKTDRLSDTERAMLMGGACAKAYGWSPKQS